MSSFRLPPSGSRLQVPDALIVPVSAALQEQEFTEFPIRLFILDKNVL